MWYTEIAFPAIVSALFVTRGGLAGWDADTMVRRIASAGSGRLTGACGSLGGVCGDIGSSLYQSVATGTRHYSLSRWAHLATILSILIYALNRHSDTMQQRRRHQKTIKLIAAETEQQECSFNLAYVEIEFVDEPGRVIKVLLDLGASCSVFSKRARALQGVFHSLVRNPPKAKLIAANGGSLGLALGIIRLKFKFRGHDEVFEHNMGAIDNDGVPCILGVDW